MRVRTWLRDKSKVQLATSALLFLALGSATAVSIEAFVRARLSDSMLSAPTRFYARPIVVERGMELERDRVENSLRRLGYEKASGRKVGIGEYRLDSRSWTIGRRAFRIYDQVDHGGVTVVRLGYGNRVSEIRDANGERLSTLALEPEIIRSVHGSIYEDRIPISLSNAPGHLMDAVLAIEDQRFFEHDGLDPRRVGGAAIANVRARRIVQGASTITQQLAKNLFLTPRRSITRKLREVAMSRALERRYSKQEIDSRSGTRSSVLLR